MEQTERTEIVTAAAESAVGQKKSGAAKLFSLLGMGTGLASVIVGIVLKGMSVGSYESSLSYGGDAYTGIQNAAAQTANNVRALANLVRAGSSAFFILLGLVLICCFALRMCRAER